jgi:hypothetical protein
VTDLEYGGCTSGRITMWETLIKYKHENYEIDDAREGVLNHKRLNFFNNLKEERSKYDTDIYMVKRYRISVRVNHLESKPMVPNHSLYS